MRFNKDIDDLEYLASLGYDKVAAGRNDVASLRNKIGKRVFSPKESGYFAVICISLGAFMGISVYFMFNNMAIVFPESSDKIAENSPVIQQEMGQDIQQLDTVGFKVGNTSVIY